MRTLAAMSASVELYPRAAILTAWINAWAVGRVDGLIECPGVSPAAPLLAPVRQPLGQALALLIAEHGPDLHASALLPVPGDPAGLPPDARDARQAGQVVALTGGTPGRPAQLLFPATSAPVRPTAWRAKDAHVAPAALATDLRAARLGIMDLLPGAVAVSDATGGRPLEQAELRDRLRRLETVPLPPGSASAAVDLARRSAALLAIVEAAAARLDADPGRRDALMAELRPLAAAGRRALAAAFSHAVAD